MDRVAAMHSFRAAHFNGMIDLRLNDGFVGLCKSLYKSCSLGLMSPATVTRCGRVGCQQWA